LGWNWHIGLGILPTSPHPHKIVWNDPVTWMWLIKKLTFMSRKKLCESEQQMWFCGLFFKIFSKLMYTLLVCWELQWTSDSELEKMTTDYDSLWIIWEILKVKGKESNS
jgi:hypothetical protein